MITLIRACPIGPPPWWGAGQRHPTVTLHLSLGTFTSDSLRKDPFRPFHILMFSLSSISPSNPLYICRAQAATGRPWNYSPLRTSLSSILPVPFYFLFTSRPCALRSDIRPPCGSSSSDLQNESHNSAGVRGGDSDQSRQVFRDDLTAISLSTFTLPKYDWMSLPLA